MDIEYKIIENGCWECTSHATDSSGYPVAIRGGTWDRIHRHYHRKFNGKIPKGKVVRHSCDNKKCINPAHLITGTHSDNVRDRVERDRSAKGENNGRSKLKKSEVLEILTDTITPKMVLARQHGVDPKVIRDIKQGKTWKHVTGL